MSEFEHGRTEPMLRDNETSEVVGMNLPNSKSPKAKYVEEETAWFTSKPKGHHFSFELNGKKFEARELPKESVKQITKRIRELGKTQKAIANKNKDVVTKIKKLNADEQAESNSDEPDWNLVFDLQGQISDLEDQQERFSDEAEPLIEEQGAVYERVCIEGLRNWELSEPLSEESIKDLSMTARRNIGDIILENSIAGGDKLSFTQRRSRR